MQWLRGDGGACCAAFRQLLFRRGFGSRPVRRGRRTLDSSGFPHEKARPRFYVLDYRRFAGLGLLSGHLCRAQRAMQDEIFRIILLPCALGHGGFPLLRYVALSGSIGFLASPAQPAERAQMFRRLGAVRRRGRCGLLHCGADHRDRSGDAAHGASGGPGMRG